MRLLLAILLAGVPVSGAMAQTADSAAIRQRDTQLDVVLQMFNNGRAAETIEILDPILAGFERTYAGETREIRCMERGANPANFAKAGKAPGAGEDDANTLLIDYAWCFALWAKGYALVDVHQIAEALPYLERAAKMSPNNPAYLSELGNAYQELRRWQPALAAYTQAVASAERLDGEARIVLLGRARRGVGFVLIELGRWDEAIGWFNQALELNPNDQRAKEELQYIEQHRP